LRTSATPISARSGRVSSTPWVKRLAIEPSAVAALVLNCELSAGRVALQTQVLAGHFIARVERQIDPEILAAAADADFVLRDEEDLRSGIVAVADLGEHFVRRAARAGAVARHAGGSDGRLAVDQGSLGAAVAGLRNVAQLGVDLHVALRHAAFGVAEQLDPPIVLGDPVRLVRAAAAEQGVGVVPCGDARGEGPAGILLNEVPNAGQALVVLGMQIDAEHARQQDAISHLQPAQLHVADQLIDDGLAADRVSGCLVPPRAIRTPTLPLRRRRPDHGTL
jgi:hypothetical protein